jgi:hypothetical protein
MLEQGERPAAQALQNLAAYALESGKTAQRPMQPFWRTRFPDRGAREVIALLKMAGSAPSWPGRYRAILLNQLSAAGYKQTVVDYWKRNRARVEADIDCWSAVSAALINLKHKGEAGKLLSGWRSRAGVRMWMVANYVMCCSSLRPGMLREVAATCRDALTGLPHDHCARYLAHMLAEALALLGDRQGLLDTWSRYREYFDRRLDENEWFESRRRYLLAKIPAMVGYLQQGHRAVYREAVWGLRWKRLTSRPVTRMETGGGGQSKTVPWWIIWIAIMLVLQVLRVLENGAR